MSFFPKAIPILKSHTRNKTLNCYLIYVIDILDMYSKIYISKMYKCWMILLNINTKEDWFNIIAFISWKVHDTHPLYNFMQSIQFLWRHSKLLISLNIVTLKESDENVFKSIIEFLLLVNWNCSFELRCTYTLYSEKHYIKFVFGINI